MQSWFYDLADYAETLVGEGEQVALSLSGETTGYARISSGRVRQTGSIEQRHLSLSLRRQGREVVANLMLSGSLDADRAPIRSAIDGLSTSLADLPEDPHLADLAAPIAEEHRGAGSIPSPDEVIGSLAGEEDGLETCGIAITGTIFRGAANNLGLRRWFEAPRTVIDGSMHLLGGGATRWVWAGENWDPGAARRRRDDARSMAVILGRPLETPSVGNYRAWLEPAALSDLFSPVVWNGAFSYRAIETGSSPLAPLYQGQKLDPRVIIRDNPGAIGAPSFNSDGHSIPAPIDLVSGGEGMEKLTSPRSAKEFGLEHNGAEGSEAPAALEMGPGSIDPETACQQIGDGIWLSHVHYTNLAAREGARVTGVSRWVALRVKGGEAVAPIGTVRVDDSIVRILGEGLVDLGSRTEVLPELHTYRQRNTSGSKLPGILVDDLRIVG